MYLINIKINQEKIEKNQRDLLLEGHRKWFFKYFEKGKFLMLGPYLDEEASGVIIAYEENRKNLEEILKEDVYYNGLADYEIREFKANLVSEKIQEFKGK